MKMEKQDVLFLSSFLVTFGLLLFFLGSSITGYTVQTSYCDSSGCHEYCRTNSDCHLQEICCEEKDFGICREDCEKAFVFSPDVEYDSLQPYSEQPSNANATSEILLYASLIFISIMLFGTYFLLRGKKVQVKV